MIINRRRKISDEADAALLREGYCYITTWMHKGRVLVTECLDSHTNFTDERHMALCTDGMSQTIMRAYYDNQ